MKILVTGGAGFIGSNFIRYMLDKHHDVEIVNFDKLTYAGNLENLRDVQGDPRYTFVRGDIAVGDQVRPAFETGATYIVNFAAESHVDRSITGPDIFLLTNVFGTQTLLNLAREYQVEKFIQISTDEVYGTLGDSGWFTESTPLAPNSPYSASKAAADLLVRSYHKTYGLPVNITRCSNNYGPCQFPEKLIPLMITNALEDKALPLYGDGQNVRDWIYVEDHCRAIDAVLRKGRNGEVYNIGGNEERTNLEIVKTILSALGKSESLIKFIADRPGHDRRYATDASKIKAQLGWIPAFSFGRGMSETIQWYLDNRRWWERVKSGAYQDYYDQMYGERLKQ